MVKGEEVEEARIRRITQHYSFSATSVLYDPLRVSLKILWWFHYNRTDLLGHIYPKRSIYVTMNSIWKLLCMKFKDEVMRLA